MAFNMKCKMFTVDTQEKQFYWSKKMVSPLGHIYKYYVILGDTLIVINLYND